MKRFKVVRNGVATNQWTSDFAGPEYYEPGFGKPGEYTIVEEDITAEVSGKKAKDEAKKADKAFLDNLTKADLKTVGDIADAFIKFINQLK